MRDGWEDMVPGRDNELNAESERNKELEAQVQKMLQKQPAKQRRVRGNTKQKSGIAHRQIMRNGGAGRG